MSALALALHLVLTAPGPGGLAPALQPRLDPGPFQGRELVASSLGVLAGDALVLGAAYGTLQLFASGTLRPSADNFRSMAYGVGVAALLVPPLTAVLLARWFRAEPASGAVWKALLLAVTGQAASLAIGYYTAPRFWLIPPAQVLAVGVGTTVGLHWGRGRPGGATESAPDARREPSDPPPAAASRPAPLCPDPALAAAG